MMTEWALLRHHGSLDQVCFQSSHEAWCVKKKKKKQVYCSPCIKCALGIEQRKTGKQEDMGGKMGKNARA